MRFRYAGPHDAVEVPALGAVVTRGEMVEATGRVAESLQQQAGVWEHVPDPKRSRAAKKAAETRATNDEAADKEQKA